MIALFARAERIEEVTFSPDSRLLAAGGNKAIVRLWDLGNPVAPLFSFSSANGAIQTIRFTLKPPHLVYMAWGGLVRHDYTTGERLQTKFTGTDPMSAIEVTTDGQYYWGRAADSEHAHMRPNIGSIYSYWEAAAPPEALGGCRAITAIPARKEVAFGTYSADERRASVVIRVAKSGKVRASHHIRATATLRRLVVSGDGRWLAVLCGTKLTLIDREQPDAPRALITPNRLTFAAMAFHPAGQLFACVSPGGVVTLFDTATWLVAKTFDWKIGRLRCVAFSPDGALAAVGSDKGQVVVWDVDV